MGSSTFCVIFLCYSLLVFCHGVFPREKDCNGPPVSVVSQWPGGLCHMVGGHTGTSEEDMEKEMKVFVKLYYVIHSTYPTLMEREGVGNPGLLWSSSCLPEAKSRIMICWPAVPADLHGSRRYKGKGSGALRDYLVGTAGKAVMYRPDSRKGNAAVVGWSRPDTSNLISVPALVTWVMVRGDQAVLPPRRSWKRPQLNTWNLHLTCHMKEPPRCGGTQQPSSVETVVVTAKEITADGWHVVLTQMPLCDSPLWRHHTWCTRVKGREGKEGKGEGKHLACLSELYFEDRVVGPFHPSALSRLTT